MAWDGTKTRMTVSGADLVLDDYAEEGSYEEGVEDLGTLDWWIIYAADLIATENPAATGVPSCKTEIKTSEDNVTWTAWEIFRGGRYYCRYIQTRTTVYGCPEQLQCPKITRHEFGAYPANGDLCQGQIEDQLATGSLPAAPRVGAKYWDTTVKKFKVALESTTPTWLTIPPRQGMRVLDLSDDQWYEVDSGGELRMADPSTLSTDHVTILGHAYGALVSGIWAVEIDTAQLLNGTYASDGLADHDEVDYFTCLKRKTYTMTVLAKKTASSGILKIYLDGTPGTLLATIDLYDAGGVNNFISRTTGIAIAVAGRHTITCYVDGQTGGSGGYQARIGSITFQSQ